MSLVEGRISLSTGDVERTLKSTVDGEVRHSETVALIDPQNGNTVRPDSLQHYQRSDWDDDDPVKYYGYLDTEGNWYIRKEDWTNKQVRYCKGTTGYADSWANRATQDYDLFSTIF